MTNDEIQQEINRLANQIHIENSKGNDVAVLVLSRERTYWQKKQYDEKQIAAAGLSKPKGE